MKRRSRRRWSAEEKVRIVRESFWPGTRVEDVAERCGLSRKQLSAWRRLARQGKLAVPSSGEPEPVIDGSEAEPAFATLEVDSAKGLGAMGSVSIQDPTARAEARLSA